jgi:hypothetical protein
MIEWFKNYLRKKRLFCDKHAMNRFIYENMKHQIQGFILSVSIIKHYMQLNDQEEIKTRSKHLRLCGLNPPVNLIECDEMINDLKRWYI